MTFLNQFHKEAKYCTGRERTGTWLSEQMGYSISTISRRMTNKVQPSVENNYTISQSI